MAIVTVSIPRYQGRYCCSWHFTEVTESVRPGERRSAYVCVSVVESGVLRSCVRHVNTCMEHAHGRGVAVCGAAVDKGCSLVFSAPYLSRFPLQFRKITSLSHLSAWTTEPSTTCLSASMTSTKAKARLYIFQTLIVRATESGGSILTLSHWSSSSVPRTLRGLHKSVGSLPAQFGSRTVCWTSSAVGWELGFSTFISYTTCS